MQPRLRAKRPTGAAHCKFLLYKMRRENARKTGPHLVRSARESARAARKPSSSRSATAAFAAYADKDCVITSAKRFQLSVGAKVVRVETDAFMKRYNALEDEIKRLNDKVDNLYKKVHELEDERIALLKRNSELELALKEAQHNLCVRPDDECLKRMPPRDYCRLVKLANGEYDEYYKTANEDEKGDTVPKKPRKGRNARQ